MYVSDAALASCIRDIRRALSEQAQQPQYVETVCGRGYRFIAPVTAATAGGLPFILPTPYAVSRTPHDAHRYPTLLIGREAELTRLQQCYAAARQGNRQVVCITGESGIGKTTLVDTFVTQIVTTDAVWLGRGQCIEQHGADEAYLPLLEAFGRLGRAADGGRLIAVLEQQAPSWLRQLPALVPAANFHARQQRVGTTATTPERMLRELAEAIETLTAEHPLVLVLEDLHWSDVSTHDWLAYVARQRLWEAPVGIGEIA